MNKTFTVKKTFTKQGKLYIIPIKEFDNEEEAQRFLDNEEAHQTVWDDAIYFIDEE